MKSASEKQHPRIISQAPFGIDQSGYAVCKLEMEASKIGVWVGSALARKLMHKG